MDPYLQNLKANWTQWGADDPLHAIIGGPRYGTWDDDAFFATGERWMGRVWEQMAEYGLPLRRGSALDFGCGAGRLTQAIASRYETAIGVDISPTMIAKARTMDRRCNVRYFECAGTEFPFVADGSLDFIYTAQVLQHINPQAGFGYLREFARKVAVNGVVAFHVTTAFRSGRVEADRPFVAARCGDRVRLGLTVTNTSSVDWPYTGELPIRMRLSLDIRNVDTGESRRDHGARYLERDLGAAESSLFPFEFNAPEKPGQYVGRFLLRTKEMEDVTPEQGCEIRLIIKPGQARSAVGQSSGVASPTMEMHVYDREAVILHMQSLGLTLLGTHLLVDRVGEFRQEHFFFTKRS